MSDLSPVQTAAAAELRVKINDTDPLKAAVAELQAQVAALTERVEQLEGDQP